MSTSNIPRISVPVEDTDWGRAELPTLPSVSIEADEDNEEDTVEVAIIGGGLAGLAVAIGLSRANIHCKVFERAPRLRSNSQGILAVQPNGMEALQAIHPDLPEMIVEAGCVREELVVTTIKADGSQEETQTKTGEDAMAKFGRKKVGITWHKMQQLLASLLPSDVVVTSRSLVSFQDNQNDIVLNFDDHHTTKDHPIRKRVRAKVAIACDGVFSVARQQMFRDDNDAPLYFGQLNWATVINTDQLPFNVHPPNAVHYFLHEGEPRWMSMLNDGGSGQSFWQFRVADPEMALSLSRNKGRGGLGLPGVKETLLPVAKACPLVAQAIESIPECQVFERSIVGRQPASTWRSEPHGRLALVGDSAHGMHPNIAQGANSSFESAAAVVQAMTEEFQRCHDSKLQDVDWPAALCTYEKRRKPKADKVQRWANMMGCQQASGQLNVPKEDISKMMDWIIGGDPKNHPSQETLDIIFAFDPCSIPCVKTIT